MIWWEGEIFKAHNSGILLLLRIFLATLDRLSNIEDGERAVGAFSGESKCDVEAYLKEHQDTYELIDGGNVHETSSVRSHKGEIRRIPFRLSKGFCCSSRNVI